MPKNESKKMFTSAFTFEGKRYYVRSAKSQREADKKAAKRQTELEEGSALLDENIRFSQYAQSWIDTYKKSAVSESQYAAYKSRIEHYITPEIGGLRMKDIRLSNLQKIMNQQSGKSKSHIDKMRVTLTAIFNRAQKDRIIRDNIASDLVMPKSQDGTHRSLTEQERSAVLAVSKTHRFGLFVRLMLQCGIRPQEAAALRWSDVDRINHRLQVRRALKKDGYIAETKSKSGMRDIPIPPDLYDMLISEMREDITQTICTNTEYKQHTHSSIKRAWESFRQAVDIQLGATWKTEKYGVISIQEHAIAPNLTMYCMRHTYCTDLEAAGIPINVARYLMGHAKIELTARIYTHIRDDTLSDAATKIARIGATVGATPNLKKTENNYKSVEVIKTQKA